MPSSLFPEPVYCFSPTSTSGPGKRCRTTNFQRFCFRTVSVLTFGLFLLLQEKIFWKIKMVTVRQFSRRWANWVTSTRPGGLNTSTPVCATPISTSAGSFRNWRCVTGSTAQPYDSTQETLSRYSHFGSRPVWPKSVGLRQLISRKYAFFFQKSVMICGIFGLKILEIVNCRSVSLFAPTSRLPLRRAWAAQMRLSHERGLCFGKSTIGTNSSSPAWPKSNELRQ